MKRRRFKDKRVFFQTMCHHQDLASTLSVDIVQTFTNSHNCFLRRSDSIFGDEKRGPI